MQTMSDLTAYKDAFSPSATEPAWLVERRRSALARFGELGLPTRRQENWRFTNLRALETTDYPPTIGDTTIDEAALAPYRLARGGPRVGPGHRRLLPPPPASR